MSQDPEKRYEQSYEQLRRETSQDYSAGRTVASLLVGVAVLALIVWGVVTIVSPPGGETITPAGVEQSPSQELQPPFTPTQTPSDEIPQTNSYEIMSSQASLRLDANSGL